VEVEDERERGERASPSPSPAPRGGAGDGVAGVAEVRVPRSVEEVGDRRDERRVAENFSVIGSVSSKYA
jgi:hypothetical protein